MPKNPGKYVGDVNNIWYRSGLELKMMKRLDDNPAILRWGSEIVVVPYFNPVKKKISRYFTDFAIMYLDQHGNQRKMIVEVKCKSETQEPQKKARVTRALVERIVTYEVNKAKWKSAIEFCKERGWEFKVVTEETIKNFH